MSLKPQVFILFFVVFAFVLGAGAEGIQQQIDAVAFETSGCTTAR